MTRRSAGRLTAAGACAVAALGLPWQAQLPGTAAPARVFVVLGIVLVAAGLRTGRDRLLAAAVLVGVAGVLVGGPGVPPGRVALAAAVGCLVAALRADGRPVLPRRVGARPDREPASVS